MEFVPRTVGIYQLDLEHTRQLIAMFVSPKKKLPRAVDQLPALIRLHWTTIVDCLSIIARMLDDSYKDYV